MSASIPSLLKRAIPCLLTRNLSRTREVELDRLHLEKAHLCFIKTTFQRSKPSASATANSDTIKLTILKRTNENKGKTFFSLK